jgi:hypothetical protein
MNEEPIEPEATTQRLYADIFAGTLASEMQAVHVRNHVGIEERQLLGFGGALLNESVHDAIVC